jgi:polyribonucleotide nucleotidyltransferase
MHFGLGMAYILFLKYVQVYKRFLNYSFLNKLHHQEKELKRQESAKDETRVPLPPEKTGLLMGKYGSTVKKFEKETGTTIDIKEKAAHIKGPLANRRLAETQINLFLKKVNH